MDDLLGLAFRGFLCVCVRVCVGVSHWHLHVTSTNEKTRGASSTKAFSQQGRCLCVIES